jgi:signal transduction histidine kinase/CheY-like chemotaxis protein
MILDSGYAFCGVVRYERTPDGYKIVEANDMAAQIMGLKNSSQIFDKGVADLEKLVFPDDYEMIKTGFDNLLYIGDSFYFTKRIANLKSQKPRFVTGVAVAVKVTNGEDTKTNFIQSTFINTTDRADLEEVKRKLAVTEAKLENAVNINKQKNMLFEDVAGNIKSHLNNIVGKAVIAKARPEKLSENVDSITESAKSVMELVNNVLDISMIEERRLFINNDHFEIAEFFENIKSGLMPVIREKAQHLHVSYNSIIHTAVIGDLTRLETIFNNLLSNAVKFTPAGGNISMSVTETGTRRGKCSFSVQISDNGIGMSKDKLMSVLAPYVSRNKADENTMSGYGLPLANELIKLLGGSIRIESNPGIGTNVYADFSLKPEMADEIYDTEAPYSFEGKHILLAEDNDISREMFADLLASEGAEVEQAESGAVALELFEHSPVYHYDIIFMDIAMPDMDGVEATKHIRALFRPDARTIPIIALTAKTPGEEVANGLNFGMDAYEQKPFDMKRIKRILSVLTL